MSLEHIKVIVFDLDGTLYEDTHHFDFYAERLKFRLSADKQHLFSKDYLSCKEHRHPLKTGRVYDAEEGLILVHMDGVVREAYRWNGEQISREKASEIYNEPINYDFKRFFSIGDPWWIPASIARHYGLSSERIYEAFLETRKFMLGPDFKMKKIPSLAEAIKAVRKKTDIVLYTNSSEEDSEGILTKLGLDGLFSLKIFNGKKPAKTVEWFTYIRDYFQVSFEEIMSVGDNWVNEIRPVKPLGCITAYIDAYDTGETAYTDFAVPTMRELLPVFKLISES